MYHNLQKKLDSSNDFLYDFVQEATKLTIEGMMYNETKLKICIYMVCADAPAKSFILNVMGHCGFYSCTKCYVVGNYLQNRVCFPIEKN